MSEIINLKTHRTYAEQEIWICIDCAMMSANGEWNFSSEEMERTVTEALDAVSARGWSVILKDEITDFSSSRCDICSSTLGGYRWEAALISRTSGEDAAESSLVIQRDGSSTYTVDEMSRLLISDIRSLRPEISLPLPDDSAEDDSADGEALDWLRSDYMSAAEDLDLLIIEDDGYQIYDLRLISEAAAESLRLLIADQFI
jgi:hypothetical protein